MNEDREVSLSFLLPKVSHDYFTFYTYDMMISIYIYIYVFVTDGDQPKVAIKDEESSLIKLEEKSCNNPLAGLANTINSITNGVNNEDSTTIPVSVPVSANSKHVPPKAMVKPQVLTHVIEGFVIQEGMNLMFK